MLVAFHRAKSQIAEPEQQLIGHTNIYIDWTPLSSVSDAGASNLPDSQAVERLLRSTALAQDYQIPLAPHLAALSELLCKNRYSLSLLLKWPHFNFEHRNFLWYVYIFFD